MGVSLPSDLIIDVLRNADTARLDAATARLESLDTQGSASARFDDHVSKFDRFGCRAPALAQNGSPLTDARLSGAVDEPYVTFERMVLRHIFESLLPQEGSGAFGTGPSAGIWRSMAADQLAGLYASSGGIGLSASLSDERPGGEHSGGGHWPYFSADSITAFDG